MNGLTQAARKATPIVRDMRGDEQDAVADLLAQLSTFERRIEADRHGDWETHRAYLEHNVRRIAGDGGAILVAESDAADGPTTADRRAPSWRSIVGCLSYVYTEDDPFICPPYRHHACVLDFFIMPRFRHHGVGRMLMNVAIARCRADGIVRMGISALARNDVAHAAYTAWGFRPYAVQHVLDGDDS